MCWWKNYKVPLDFNVLQQRASWIMTQLAELISDAAQHRRFVWSFEEHGSCLTFSESHGPWAKLKICSSEADKYWLTSEGRSVKRRGGRDPCLTRRCRCQSWDEVISCDARSSWTLMDFLKTCHILRVKTTSQAVAVDIPNCYLGMWLMLIQWTQKVYGHMNVPMLGNRISNKWHLFKMKTAQTHHFW